MLTAGEKTGSIETVIEVRPGLEVTITRQLKGTRAELTFSDGREPVIGSDAVNQAILDLLGVDKTTLTNIVFVGQSELGALLYSRDAERERLAQQFFGVERANRIERMIGERINSKLLTATSTPTDNLVSQLVVAENELQQVQQQLAAVARADDEQVLAQLTQLLSVYRAHETWKTRETLRLESLAAATEQIGALNLEIESNKRNLGGLEVSVLRGKLDVEKNKRLNFQRRAALLTQQAAAEQQLAALTSQPAPCTQEFIDGLEAEYESLSNLRAADAVVPAIQQGIIGDLALHASTTCPVCLSEICQERRPVIQGCVDAARDTDNKIHSLPELRTRIQNWKTSLAAHERRIQTLSIQVENGRAEIESLAAYAVDGEVEKWQTNLDYIEGLTRTLASLTDQWRQLDQRITQLQQGEPAPAGAESIIVFNHEEAEAEIQTIRTRQASASEFRIHIARLESDVRNLQARIEENRRIDDSNRQTERLRSELGKLRAAFHPDGEPHTLVSRRAERMVAKINEYLGILDVPFTVASSGGFNFEAIFPDKPVSISIRELSGGQKDDLSLAFRFAACESFSATAGLLVLDEPTAALDAQTKHNFSAVLERLREMARTLNMQFIVITHDQQFMSAFDQVIDFGSDQ